LDVFSLRSEGFVGGERKGCIPDADAGCKTRDLIPNGQDGMGARRRGDVLI